MAQVTEPAFQVGELVTASRMASVQDGARGISGSLISLVLGIASANSMDFPFTVSAPGGMSILAGGSGGQKVLLQSSTGPRLVDAIPSQTFTVPNASTVNPRIDLLCGQYAQVQISAGTGQIATLSGSTVTTSNQAISNATEAMTYQYVTGTAAASPVAPTVPSGFIALASITVGTSVAAIVAGNIAILLTSAQTQILSGVAGFVDLTSNQTIVGLKTFTTGATISGLQMKFGDVAITGGPGLRVNTAGSVLLSPTAPGHTVSLGYDDPSLLGVYFGPQNTWGYVGTIGYNSPDGTATYGSYCIVKNGQVHAGSSITSIGSVGDGIFERNGPSGAIFLGNSGSGYLYFDGSNYNFGRGPAATAPVLNFPGPIVTTSGVAIPNGGSQSINVFTFGNTTSAGGGTGIGSRGASVNGIVPSILNIENIGTSQLFAMDQYGNIGLAGGLIATALTSTGNASITGTLAVSGVQLPTVFISPDSSVNLSSSSGTLFVSLPAGFGNSFTSADTSAITVAGSGTRSLSFNLNANIANNYASDGSISVSVAGRVAAITSAVLSYRRQVRPTTPGTAVNLSLPTLIGSASRTWLLYARITLDINGGGSMSLAGSGATWETSISQSDTVTGPQIIELIGTGVGGQTPQVTLNYTGVGADGIGILIIEAHAG
jgi:hypothetical protein